MKWMDVDIALASVPVNILPLVLASDGKTIDADVVYNESGLALFWNFTTTGGVTTVTAVTPTTSGVYDWTDFTTSGMYGIEIPASGGGTINNDAEGVGHFTGVTTAALPWRGPEVGFRAVAINDALIDSDTLISSDDLGLHFESLITTVTNQQEFICTTSIVSDDAWNNLTCTIKDVSTGESVSRRVTDVIASTDVIKINSAPPFTVVANDKIRVFREDQAAGALVNYDPPTRAEATTDTNSILAKILAYVRLMTRSDGFVDTDDSVELTAINASGGSGAGDYDPETDSIEARADNVDDTNITKVNSVTVTGAGTSGSPWGP